MINIESTLLNICLFPVQMTTSPIHRNIQVAVGKWKICGGWAINMASQSERIISFWSPGKLGLMDGPCASLGPCEYKTITKHGAHLSKVHIPELKLLRLNVKRHWAVFRSPKRNTYGELLMCQMENHDYPRSTLHEMTSSVRGACDHFASRSTLGSAESWNLKQRRHFTYIVQLIYAYQLHSQKRRWDQNISWKPSSSGGMLARDPLK